MRRSFFFFLLLLSLAACRRDRSAELAEVVSVADQTFTPQLLRGFHPVEDNSWRWTQGRFAVALKPPKQAANGAVLVLKYSLPDAALAKLANPKISVSVEGLVLAPEPIAKPGLQELRREVPADTMKGKSAVTAEFAVDPFLAPSETDQRELGVIVHSIGLIKR